MTAGNDNQMDILEQPVSRNSYLSEIERKLSEGAPRKDLLSLVTLAMASILDHRERLLNACSPSRFHRRNKAYRQHAQRLMTQMRGVVILGKFIKSNLPDRDNADWEAKLSEILDLVENVAVDCLKRTVHNEQLIVQAWTGLFHHELDQKRQEIFRAIKT